MGKLLLFHFFAQNTAKVIPRNVSMNIRTGNDKSRESVTDISALTEFPDDMKTGKLSKKK